MDQRNMVAPPPEEDLSPYRTFSRDDWARLRADTPLTLTAEEVWRLQSLHDPISLDEVIAIYLPLSRLLSLYVAATQGLFKATQRFLLAEKQEKVPYIIGVSGSVAVGNQPPPAFSRRSSPAGPTPRKSTSSPPMASCCRTPSWNGSA